MKNKRKTIIFAWTLTYAKNIHLEIKKKQTKKNYRFL